MKKHISFLFLTALLSACSATVPNIVNTTKPILNMEAALVPLLNVEVSERAASVENKTDQPISFSYGLFWYDKNGVTQFEPVNFMQMYLNQRQKAAIGIAPPTAESVNYRLYLRAK